VNSRCEPRRNAWGAGYSNIASASSNHISNAGRQYKPSGRKTDNISQEVDDRHQLVSGDEYDASERAEDGPENCVRHRPADVEQEVLANLVGREMTGTPVAVTVPSSGCDVICFEYATNDPHIPIQFAPLSILIRTKRTTSVQRSNSIIAVLGWVRICVVWCVSRMSLSSADSIKIGSDDRVCTLFHVFK